jgi:hypothetical protein
MFSQRMTNSFRPILIAAGLLAGLASANAQSTTAQRTVDELLAVDREHARGAQRRNVVDALGGMFADDVVMSAMVRSIVVVRRRSLNSAPCRRT